MIAFAFSLCVLFAPTDDLRRFPSAGLADRYWRLSASHMTHLGDIAPYCGSHHWEAMLVWRNEASYCYQCWNTLDNAYRNTTWRYRVEYLRQLRDLLGDEAYFMGMMPPPVPYWRFQQIN